MAQITDFLLLLYCNRGHSSWMKKAVSLSTAKNNVTIPAQVTASKTMLVGVCSAESTWVSKACTGFEIRPVALQFAFKFR